MSGLIAYVTQLLEHDGLEMDWLGVAADERPDHDGDQDAAVFAKLQHIHRDFLARSTLEPCISSPPPGALQDDETREGEEALGGPHMEPTSFSTYKELQQTIVTSFNRQWQEHRVVWPRRREHQMHLQRKKQAGSMFV